ncbi:2OG-Fe(II) oxygenase [Singulisphaera sp. PoT]|uniref:2OG-Fe(II) oxygenase n=1 Tax=Singulisphaera sp. PoT TaxID=3411797 RepID=UPI003BF4CF1F
MAIVVRENFLSPQECADIIQCAKTLTTWDTRAQGYWNSRIAHATEFLNPAARDQLVEIRKRVGREIRQSYGLTQPITADTLQIVRWPEGFDQAPHADAENPNGAPHPYAWRAFASLIYVNNDYEGGQIFFPNQRLAPKITPGMLVFFPGTLEYLHGVTKVTQGVRYTVASFWTFDLSKGDGLPVE